MTTTFSHILNGSLDTAIAGATLNGLTNTSYAVGTPISNVPASGTTVGYDKGELTITFSSTLTTGSGSPYLDVSIIPTVDGTKYPGTSGATPTYFTKRFPLPPSINIGDTIVCPDLDIPPYTFKVQIQNGTGATFPANNSTTCQLQRRAVAAW